MSYSLAPSCREPDENGIDPAVAEARRHMRRLHAIEYRGPGDTDEAVRRRIERKTGVPVSYLVRLHKKHRDMTDVSGRWARLLRLACEALDRAAARSEQRTQDIDDELEAIARRRAEGAGP